MDHRLRRTREEVARPLEQRNRRVGLAGFRKRDRREHLDAIAVRRRVSLREEFRRRRLGAGGERVLQRGDRPGVPLAHIRVELLVECLEIHAEHLLKHFGRRAPGLVLQ